MKQYLLKKKLFTVVFIIVLFGFSIINFANSYEELEKTLQEKGADATALDLTINENMYEKMKFIETYAYVQNILDKRESNNFSYVKDENGFLHYANFYKDDDTQIFDYALRVKRLQNYVETYGTKVLFVVPPGKYDTEYSKIRKGLPVNDPNDIVDELIFHLNRLDVETLDMRLYLPNEKLSYEETFFKTDHHWTVPAAFYTTGKIVEKMKDSFGVDLDPDGYYTDWNTYEQVTYEAGMLGSMGRKTGVNFSGIDDFTALWPKFEGNFHREYIQETGDKGQRKGNFIKTMMYPEILQNRKDIYSDSYYSLYLNGISEYEKIENLDNPDGCSIFMIRDSYMSPIMTFMMPMCGEIHAIWSLEDEEELDIEKYLKENQFDYIIIEVYPYNINSDAFNYFKTENVEVSE